MHGWLEQSIATRGPGNGPADDKRGHAGNCSRMAAVIALHEAEWPGDYAQWEAGQ